MLVNCVAYQNGRKLADLPVEDISEYVSRPDCFVWVALFEPDASELDLLADDPVGCGIGGAAVQGVDHGEKAVAVLDDLGPVAGILRVFHRELVQPEFVGKELELAGVRLEQRHPDEAVGTAHVLGDVLDGQVRELAAVLVGDAIDEHQGSGVGDQGSAGGRRQRNRVRAADIIA